MITNLLERVMAGDGADLGGGGMARGEMIKGRQDKSADRGRAHVVVLDAKFDHQGLQLAGAPDTFLNEINARTAIGTFWSVR